MGEVVIHPGLPKVATTSLQKDFYPHLEGINYVGKSHSFLNKTDVLLCERIYQGDINGAKKIVKHLTTENVNLFSYERWYHGRDRKIDDRFLLADRLHAVFPEAKVIIGVREKASLLMSWYKEAVKCGYPDSFITYINNLNKDLLNWKEYVGYMEELYGADRVFVYSLNDIKNRTEETLSSMSDFIGCRGGRYNLGRYNVGYGRIQLIISLHLNKLFRTKNNPKGIIPCPILPHRLLFEKLPLPDKKIDMEFLLERL